MKLLIRTQFKALGKLQAALTGITELLRPEIFEALSAAKREVELHENEPESDKNTNCPIQPLKHNLKNGAFSGVERRLYSLSTKYTI